MADRFTKEQLKGIIQGGATLLMTTEDGTRFEWPLAYISIDDRNLWYRFIGADSPFQGMPISQRVDDITQPSITLWLRYGWRAEITPIADADHAQALEAWKQYAIKERRAGRSVWPIESDLPEGIRYEI